LINDSAIITKSDLRVDQKVFRLDISMDNVRPMTESYTLDHLVGEESQTFGLFTSRER